MANRPNDYQLDSDPSDKSQSVEGRSHIRLGPGPRLCVIRAPRGHHLEHLALEAVRTVDAVPVPPRADVVPVARVRRAPLEPAVGRDLLGDVKA